MVKTAPRSSCIITSQSLKITSFTFSQRNSKPISNENQSSLEFKTNVYSFIPNFLLKVLNETGYDYTIFDKIINNESITVVVSARGKTTDHLESILEKAKSSLPYLEEFEQMKKSGDFELWPFKTKAEYQKQLENQPFLIGTE